jgi:hypothetical protein
MIYVYLLLGFLLMVGPHALSPQLEDVAQTLAQTPAAESSNGNRTTQGTTGLLHDKLCHILVKVRFGSKSGQLCELPNALGV